MTLLSSLSRSTGPNFQASTTIRALYQISTGIVSKKNSAPAATLYGVSMLFSQRMRFKVKSVIAGSLQLPWLLQSLSSE